MQRKTILFFLVFFLTLTGVCFSASSKDYYDRGMILYKGKKYEKALKFFVYAAKLEKRPEHYRMAGECYAKLGNTAAAKKYLEYAEKIQNADVREHASPNQELPKFKAAVSMGYTSAAMSTLNDYIDQAYSDFESIKILDPSATAEKNNAGSGLFISAEGAYAVIPNLYAGIKLQYVGGIAGGISGSFNVTEETEFENTFSLSIIPVMAGASYEYTLNDVPLSISGSLYMGLGLASGHMIESVTAAGTNMTADFGAEGSCFAVEIGVNGAYPLTGNIGIGLNLGYRIAYVDEMTATEDSGLVEKGDVVKVSGVPISFDFSGIIIGLKAEFLF